MVRTTCESCGTTHSAAYTRVFGDADGRLWHCRACTSQRAVGHGAGTGPDHDGTRRIHKPGLEEPVPATLQDDTADDDHEGLALAAAHERVRASTVEPASGTDDEAFDALVAK